MRTNTPLNLIFRFGAIIGFIALVYFVSLFIVGMSQGLSMQEMDWNKNGTTSLMEIINSADVVKLDVKRDGKPCVEYLRPKDASLFKVVCRD